MNGYQRCAGPRDDLEYPRRARPQPAFRFLTRVVEIIRRWHPDIVALQEVDLRRGLAGGANAFEFFCLVRSGSPTASAPSR